MKKIFAVILLLIFGISFAFPVMAQLPHGAAQQQSLSLTVTPPLLQIVVTAGDTFRSTVKIVNTNDYELVVYATPVNFAAQGEDGASRFLPVLEEDPEAGEYSLAHWIDITQDAIVVPPYQSVDVEYAIRVPENAEPGGHYGALLIGPQAAKGGAEGPSVSVAALVSSLMFVRIPGDTVESGHIREFIAEKAFYEKSEVKFLLRFENTGNVHVQPQGDIAVYNMWGKKRGFIPVNQKTDFGNVLPKSMRKFEFEWRGEQNVFEVGRYKAMVTLGYGDDGKQFVTSTAYFWIVPLKPTLFIVGGIIAFITIIIAGLRLYIRRALLLYQKQYGTAVSAAAYTPSSGNAQTAAPPMKAFIAPITESIIDLRAFVKEGESERAAPVLSTHAVDLSKKPARRNTQLPFVVRLLRRYVFFFSFITVFILGVVGITIYFAQVFTRERSYEVTVSRGNREVTISSEEIIKEELGAQSVSIISSEEDIDTAPPPSALRAVSIAVLNGSGIPGVAARFTVSLEEKGYTVARLGNADSFRYKDTIMYYRPDKEGAARLVAETLGFNGVLKERADQEEDIVVILGEE